MRLPIRYYGAELGAVLDLVEYLATNQANFPRCSAIGYSVGAIFDMAMWSGWFGKTKDRKEERGLSELVKNAQKTAHEIIPSPLTSECDFRVISFDKSVNSFRELEKGRKYGQEVKVTPYGDPSLVVLETGKRLSKQSLETALQWSHNPRKPSLGYVLGEWTHFDNFSIDCAPVQFYEFSSINNPEADLNQIDQFKVS